jgi:hypothetical protein
VAPRSPDIAAFAENLERASSWLEPFNGFGPDTFLVGRPEFSFEDYKPWIDARFKPNRFPQLETKMGLPVKYAIGSFIQALGQNPGLEEELKRLGTRSHVYVGTGLGDLGTQQEQALALHHAMRRWNRFWSTPETNSALAAYLAGEAPDVEPPVVPASVPDTERDEADEDWWEFWAGRSPELRTYLDELRRIESIAVEGEVEAGKMAAFKEKGRQRRRLAAKWGAPDPPWESVSPNLIWNIDNIAAAQISMLAGLKGMTMAPAAACSTFGVALKLALDAIRSNQADAVVVGATDPPPHPLTVGAFYNARVISADAQISKPLTELRGTHVAGGSVIWIVGAIEHMLERGMRPLGMEPVAVGVTSDADHIITPSREGPTKAMQIALEESEVSASRVTSWDLHATATPGDFNEVEMVCSLMPPETLLTARKGTFGHGMSAGGGWELTAQYLSWERGVVYPTPLGRGELNRQIAEVHDNFAFDDDCQAPDGVVGKLSMGIGGINACVISRPWPAEIRLGDAVEERVAAGSLP